MIGALELVFRLTPFEDGAEPVVTTSTPAMFALADEFADELKAAGKHTDGWIASKFVTAIAVQAMQAEGIAPAAPLSLHLLATALNLCDFDVLDSPPDPDEDPTQAAPGEGLGAGAAM